MVMPRISQDEFLRRARKIHSDEEYDYSQVVYDGMFVPVTITCKICGRTFKQRPNNLLNGGGWHRGHPRMTTEDFIKKAMEVHGDKYDYSKVFYTGNADEVTIICPIHGEFTQTADNHLQGRGCMRCGKRHMGDMRTKTQEQFLAEARAIHGNKFDYSMVKYVRSDIPITLKCNVCGHVYDINPGSHLSRCDCPMCAGKIVTTEDFIRRSKEVHGDRYDYSKSVYKNNHDNIIVICRKHGPFKTTLLRHVTQRSGCPICNLSKGEERVRVFLEKHKVKFDQFQYIKSPLARNKKGLFIVDFILDDGRTFIEYNGEQHYKVGRSRWGGDEGVAKRRRRDAGLRQYCKQNGITLIEIPYTDFERIEEILTERLGL